MNKFNILIACMAAWLIAQAIKVLIGVIKERKFNFKWFVGTGGLPSSHAAGVAALAASVGLYSGFNSPLFAVALVFTVVVMFDAQGVRRAAGKQAEILNRILDDIYFEHRVEEGRLKELLGHTPVEVLTGGLIGILVALAFFR